MNGIKIQISCVVNNFLIGGTVRLEHERGPMDPIKSTWIGYQTMHGQGGQSHRITTMLPNLNILPLLRDNKNNSTRNGIGDDL